MIYDLKVFIELLENKQYTKVGYAETNKGIIYQYKKNKKNVSITYDKDNKSLLIKINKSFRKYLERFYTPEIKNRIYNQVKGQL